ncbi:hypothetical protein CYLTODRAFT_447693 [Cylindrobasidium torrendii FP15055 ss-10]|uniref:F-box domain-containing protein n=1 Tax=Cylindrobasidium torrendii FP15055 ss-10 TaxID=1314674 RepID=A0A0D7AW24_9AGAR|nr:hypothetical protein CYLTODRAFT_447693 [Cylindrobasidium torrendii FP15055 ss-10]
MDTIPQELVESVLDQLAFDREALKTCSLVSRSFSHRSRKLLFANIVLEPKETSKRNPSEDFAGLLSRSLSVAPLVQALTLYNFSRGRSSWFSQDRTTVPYILRSLTNLNRLTLSGRHYDRRWDGSSDINPVLCRAISQPQLRSLTLAYASFLQPSDFLLLFADCPNLRHVRLSHVYISDQFTLQLLPPIPSAQVTRPRIESLLIQNVPTGLIDVLHDAVDLSSLRKLQFYNNGTTASSDPFQNLLEAAGESLEQVIFHGYSSSPANGIDLSQVPNIKCFFTINNFHSGVTVLSGLTELFFQRYDYAAARMHSVLFHVRCHPKALIECPKADWTRLERALVHVRRKVRFEIPVTELEEAMDDPLENAAVDTVRRGLGKLQEAGKLEVVMVQMAD